MSSIEASLFYSSGDGWWVQSYSDSSQTTGCDWPAENVASQTCQTSSWLAVHTGLVILATAFQCLEFQVVIMFKPSWQDFMAHSHWLTTQISPGLALLCPHWSVRSWMPGHHAFSMNFMSLSLPSTRQLLEWKSAKVVMLLWIAQALSFTCYCTQGTERRGCPECYVVTSSFIFVSFHPHLIFCL